MGAKAAVTETAKRVEQASTAFAALFKEAAQNAKPDYEKFATTVPSSAASTGYGFLGEFPMIKEWVGERDIKELTDHNYSVTNKLFQASISVPLTDFEDNDYGKYGPLFSEMGAQGRIYPDDVSYELLKNGATNLCYDGQPFFSDSHPAGESVVSNVFLRADEVDAPSWYLLDTSRALKPLIFQERVKPQIQQVAQSDGSISYYTFKNDAYLYGVRARGNAGYTLWQLAAMSNNDLTEDNFNAVYDAMSAVKTGDGRPMRIKPLLLIVPVALRADAQRLINSQYLPGGETNPLYQIVEVLVSPWL